MSPGRQQVATRSLLSSSLLLRPTTTLCFLFFVVRVPEEAHSWSMLCCSMSVLLELASSSSSSSLSFWSFSVAFLGKGSSIPNTSAPPIPFAVPSDSFRDAATPAFVPPSVSSCSLYNSVCLPTTSNRRSMLSLQYPDRNTARGHMYPFIEKIRPLTRQGFVLSDVVLPS